MTRLGDDGRMNDKLPTRTLGRTGREVSILGLGGVTYNFLDDAAAAAVVHRAIDLGVNYIDTAYGYKDSERKIGPVLAERRDEVYIATKTIQRGYDEASREIDESFKRLQTDHIDCLQIHDLHSEADLKTIMASDGALKAIEQRKDAGLISYVGVTSHVDPDALAMALRAYPFDTLLTSLGAVHEAVRPFYDTLIPLANELGVGVIAMKVFAYGFLKHRTADALRFTLGMDGVATSIVGVDNMEQLEANVAAAKAFTPLSDDERADLLRDAAETYERRKDDAWFITKPEATPATT